MQTPEDVVVIPPGAILVVPTLSVRFASAFAQAAGVVAEHGGPLSNGATLAREAGVPAVVLEGATALLQADDFVVIDGASGGITVQRAR